MAEREPPESGPSKRGRGDARDDAGLPLGLILAALLAAYGLLFILFNAGEVEVSFVFFDATISLVVALLITGAIGFAGGYAVRDLRARRRARRQAP